jgi:hypothetical protein
VAALNCGRNRIARPGDDPVTGGRQKSRYQFTEIFHVAGVPIRSIAFVDRLSRRPHVITRDMGLKMRWHLHVLVRLAITATSTNSAAAQVERGKPSHCEQQARAFEAEFIQTGEQGSQALRRSELGVRFRPCAMTAARRGSPPET